MDLRRFFRSVFNSHTLDEAPRKQAVLDLYIDGFDRAAQEGVNGVLKFMRGYAEKADNVHVDPRITPVLKLLRDAGYMSDHPLQDDGSASFIALNAIRQGISQMQKLGETANPMMFDIALKEYDKRAQIPAYSKFEA